MSIYLTKGYSVFIIKTVLTSLTITLSVTMMTEPINPFLSLTEFLLNNTINT